MIRLDTTTTPIVSMVIIAVVVVFLTLVIYKIISKINSLKIGPLQLQIAKEHSGNSAMYFMNMENDDHDQEMREKIAEITDSLRIKLLNILSNYHVCSVIRIAVADNLVIPLTRAGYNNHFNRVLAKDRYTYYREKLISQVKDRYVAMENSVQEIRCGIMEEFPPWSTVSEKRNADGTAWAKGSHVGEDIIREVVDFWLEQVVSIVIQMCQYKIETYQKYKPQFVDDQYRLDIVTSRIEKNQNYLVALERRLSQQAYTTERRRCKEDAV